MELFYELQAETEDFIFPDFESMAKGFCKWRNAVCLSKAFGWEEESLDWKRISDWKYCHQNFKFSVFEGIQWIRNPSRFSINNS